MTALALRQVPFLPMFLRRNYGNAYGSGVFGREMTVVGLGFVGELRMWLCVTTVFEPGITISGFLSLDHRKGRGLKAGFMGTHVGNAKDSPFGFVFLDSFCFTTNF
jgi:hypothetical protein